MYLLYFYVYLLYYVYIAVLTLDAGLLPPVDNPIAINKYYYYYYYYYYLVSSLFISYL